MLPIWYTFRSWFKLEIKLCSCSGMICWALLLPVLVSCFNDLELKEGKYGAITIDAELHLDSVKIVDWGVGRGFKNILSKGFVVKIDVPTMSKSDVLLLHKRFSIDAWLIRIRRRGDYSSGGVEGYYFVPLVRNDHVRGLKVQSISSSKFKVYYASAYMSRRFENFFCPAFHHRFYLTDVLIKDDRIKQRQRFNIFKSDIYQVQGKVEPFNMTAFKLNGGNSLIGRYQVDLAFYNTIEKRRKSNYLPFQEFLEVKDERRREVKGCANFKIPSKAESYDVLKSLRRGF
ncbi:MAG: hypothetical protein HN353_13980 [Bdellovibrionales bacterium]|nr:hypothetical protein [Bdellovibrionales bacterium]MBT3526964.1 hypothetical protein [Bdellovibrionales bacterium]MBT7670328.1 hypothetical protein [Bdellovibrionales bacterium]